LATGVDFHPATCVYIRMARDNRHRLILPLSRKTSALDTYMVTGMGGPRLRRELRPTGARTATGPWRAQHRWARGVPCWAWFEHPAGSICFGVSSVSIPLRVSSY